MFIIYYDRIVNIKHLVIRIEGEVRPIGREMLDEILEGNPYVDMVYPTERDHSNLQVFHLHTGEGFYHSLSQGHRYTFEINADDVNARLDSAVIAR